MSNFDGALRQADSASLITRHLMIWLKGDEAAGSYVKDYSIYGGSWSPLHMPVWPGPGKSVIRLRGVVPTSPNGFLYEATSGSGTFLTGATEPVWPTTPGLTVTDNPGANEIVFTCRAVPDYWSSLAGWVTIDNGVLGTLCPKWKRPPLPLMRLMNPMPTQPAVAVSGTTISAALADTSINDSANSLGVFAVGDWLLVSGFTNHSNNGIHYVSTKTSAKLVLRAPASPTVDEAAGNTIIIQKIYAPPSLVFGGWISSTASDGSSSAAIWSSKNYFGSDNVGMGAVWGPLRALQFEGRDLNIETWGLTSVVAPGNGQLHHSACVINLEPGTSGFLTASFYTGGTLRNSLNLTKNVSGLLPGGFLLPNYIAVEDDLINFSIGRRGTPAADGVWRFHDFMLYCGTGLPAIFTGASNDGVVRMSGLSSYHVPTPLTAVQWP